MKVSRSTIIDLPPQTVWTEVQTAPLLQHIAWPLVRFIPVDVKSFDEFKSGGRYRVKLRLLGLIPFGTQWIVSSVHEPESGDWPKRLRDNGYSALIDKWNHWITVAPATGGGTQYSDDVEISAGIMTPFVWAFAQSFYWHRQRRWRRLAQTLHPRGLVVIELAAYQAARASSERDVAWIALERVHILSQPYLGLHLANHWAMLCFAVSERDMKEIVGQIFRLALAPLGALSGSIPTGNTGRSNVSAFVPMDIPADIQAKMRNDKM